MLTIRTENVFSTIAEISETLSLTNEPDKLLHTTLDTLAEVLNVESGWVQTIDGRGDLTLVSTRGFTPDMISAVGGLKRNHPLVHEVIGLGHKVVITNISSSEMEGLDAFQKAGVRWLIAVPLMTYRVHGILGAASRYRRRLDKHTPDLIMVTGRLIATALAKMNLARVGTVLSATSDGNGKKPLKYSGPAEDDVPKHPERQSGFSSVTGAGRTLSSDKREINTIADDLREKLAAGPPGTGISEDRSPVIETVRTKQPDTLDVTTATSPVNLDKAARETPHHDTGLTPMNETVAVPDATTGILLLPVMTDTSKENDRTEIIEKTEQSEYEISPMPQPESYPEGPASRSPLPEPMAAAEVVLEESSSGQVVTATAAHQGNNGKKPGTSLRDTVEQDDEFTRHARRMDSFRAHHAPLK